METVNARPTIELPPISMKEVDLSKAFLSFDRESDTLMIHLLPRGEPGITVFLDDHYAVRLDRSQKRLLGFQIEGFLIAVVREQPALLDALDVAELRGITLEEIALLRREIGAEQRKAETIEEVFNRLAHAGDVSV